MTTTETKSTSCKRLVIFATLTCTLLAAAWMTNFLLSFDLNDYRRQVEVSLSSLLSLPVTIADIHYNFHDANLALRINGLRVGNNNSAIELEAADTIINLQWMGLLQHDIKFTKISLTEPRILLRTAADRQNGAGKGQDKLTPIIIDQELLQTASIDAVEILSGTVLVDLTRPGQPLQQVTITGLDANLSEISLGRTLQLAMKGILLLPGQGTGSEWQLAGKSTLEMSRSEGLAPSLNLDLGVKNLDLGAAIDLFAGHFEGYSIVGKSALQLHVEGSPAAGIDFQAGLSSGSMALKPGPSYSEPINCRSLLVSGHLQTRGDHPEIRDLSLQVDDSRLAGSLNWAPPGQPFMATFILHESKLKIARIKQWLPDNVVLWKTIRQKLQDQGAVQIDRAEVTLHEDSAAQKKWRLDQIKGEVRQTSWTLDDTHSAEITSLPFELSGNRWQIMRGRGQLGALRMEASGTGEFNQGTAVLTTLDFSGDFPPAQLFEEWRVPTLGLVTNGQIGIKGHLEGSTDQLSLDLQADLSQFSIIHPAGLHLNPEPGDKLTLHGTLSPEVLSLDHGALKWSFAKGHVSGTSRRDDPDTLSLDALLTIDDLARLAETLPLLKKLQLRGQADLSIRQRGLPEDNSPDMTLTLRDAGLRASRFIADINQINGRIQLTPTGLSAENLRVHLGQSPVTVQAQLDDFNNPRLILKAKAPSIRADELVFRSNKALLREIDGHLEIDRDGLIFAPVDVHLDGGTDASVRGTISFHPPFAVQLDVSSEFAKIAEVIGLWTNHTSREKTQLKPDEAESPERKTETSIRISAKVKRGDLYGMSFHDATGIIIPTRARLSIHPLDFSVGDGFCNAQVLTAFSPGAPTLLRISGHAEDVDALEVYRELLNQKNIVRGKLRGDFYLTGEIGASYLPSSYGNFSIQIHDGVLHQFQFLSKVFSLLNVSQIFSLQLPDMDNEGMPFDTLSANIGLDQGILRTEDLNIQSEAMNQSYVGQLNLVNKEIDLSMAIHPLGTVDKVVSRIPVAGWLLTGEDRALLTAHFTIKGRTDDVSVAAMPFDTITEPTIGLLRRILRLPFKLFEDPQILWGGEKDKE